MIEPISKSVKASSHTAPYKMHKYFARRPYNVFQNLIQHYTSEGDVVLDVFCGGGVTVFESLALSRKVIGVDLNPLATFITEMQVKYVPIDDLKKLFEQFLTKAKEKYNHFYEFELEDSTYDIQWVEWAYVVSCPICSSSIVLREENKVMKEDGKYKNGFYNCPNKDCSTNKGTKIGVKRTECKPLSSTPIRLKVSNKENSNTFVHVLTDREIGNILKKDYSCYLTSQLVKPDGDIPNDWDRTHEDKLFEKGVSKFSDLFTERNFIVNVLIYNDILSLRSSVSKDLLDCLYFAFSSSLRYTNNMSRVTENWENGNPTSMDKHAYWLPNQYIEANVIKALERRMSAVVKGLDFTVDKMKDKPTLAQNFKELIEDDGSSYMILNQSSSNLPIPDRSISAVITDPPYGSNVQYGELSSYWNVWLKAYKQLDDFIFNREEAVMNRKKVLNGFKDVHHYEEVLYQVFHECNRVLKDDGYLVFTFNNKNLKVWIAMLKATIRAGFIIAKNGVIFQDFVQSYKNTSHLKYSGNVHGDFIYSFVKGEHEINESLRNSEPMEYIKTTISSKIKELFRKKYSYTTAQLYQELFYDLISVLSDLIVIDINANDSWFAQIEEQSNDIIDRILKAELIFEENKWCLREEKK
ncbi:DNA methyltransferase [Bacillus safensis]|uniref:DNA methyltransferase n=1 Tax=Bacillus safensis TaxID=561879 RepID=UPI00240D6CBD|nr:DNA methyltransferase [Bacillus safensis]WEZ16745.1 DNA methyltransferase [Bacillus safensis]